MAVVKLIIKLTRARLRASELMPIVRHDIGEKMTEYWYRLCLRWAQFRIEWHQAAHDEIAHSLRNAEHYERRCRARLNAVRMPSRIRELNN
jgi:hypothetical protein